MKKLIFATIMLLFNTQISAQEITKEMKMMFKTDDISQFSKVVNKENIDKCYSIDEFSYSLLALSIKMNKSQIFQKLIDEKADPNHICDDKTPLMYAVKYGNLDFVKKLLQSGADKNAKSTKGNTALDYAKKYDQKEIAKILE